MVRVSIIGSGNLATSMAYNFDFAGHRLVQVISKTAANAEELAAKYGAFHSDKISDLIEDVDLLLLCVSDAQIATVASQISKYYKGIVCHCSGAIPLDALNVCPQNTGVFYPLQSFTKSQAVSMLNVPLMIEAESPQKERYLCEVADSISNKVSLVSSEDRKKYHLSAVFANNFSNLMFALSKQYLESQDLKFDFLRPIIQQTAERIKDGNPEDWQTGPALRKDVDTINAHLSMLKNKDLEEIYRLLSEYAMTKL